MAVSTLSSGEYIRPFGENAPWNISVAGLTRAEDSDQLARLLWNDTSTDRADRNFNINNTAYTYPVYEVEADTPMYEVDSRYGWGNLDGKKMPFDPSWKAAPGSDGQIIVLDPATGREWDLWQASFDGSKVTVSNGNLIQGQGGSDSYFEREVGFTGSRGAGIPYLAMLVRPEEVASGRIEHALSLPVQNTSGTEYVAPATKIEFPDHPAGIPEGTRYALDVTYAQIDAHLASLPSSLSDVTISSLRTIMVAMKEYGWFITDTSGGTHFQLESTTSAMEEWKALGMVDESSGGKLYPRDALDGLLSQDRIYAIVPSDEYGSLSVDDPVDNGSSGDGEPTDDSGDGEPSGDATGTSGADYLVGGDGNDVLRGRQGDDFLKGGRGDDRLYGGGGDDELLGSQDADLLVGGGGDDLLRGQYGDDRLVGGSGSDILIGGEGTDTFAFNSALHSKSGRPDILRAGDGAASFEGAGSTGGDVIDVSGIDADETRSGDQAFEYGGTGKGQLSTVADGDDLIIRGNTDNDSAFEFMLVVEDGWANRLWFTGWDFDL